MAQAVGGSTDKGGDGAEDAVPAAGGKAGGNQNIPEQPSQGSVASAVGAVMGGAKACVAGADDVSRANVTFSSNGTVSSVSVTGWAAATRQDRLRQGRAARREDGAVLEAHVHRRHDDSTLSSRRRVFLPDGSRRKACVSS